jgi:lysozyme
VPTIGYGTTIYPDGSKVKLGEICSNEQAEAFLQHDLIYFNQRVDALATDSINQNQFDALVSFCYNVGSKGLQESTLLKFINTNPIDNDNITIQFVRWNKGGGKVLAGLTRRRKAEAFLYTNGKLNFFE